ncbi:MAG: LuxR C-terminal-related transcriptional regulator [Actinomycetota bacterium]
MQTERVRQIVEQVTGGGTAPRAAIVGPDGYGRTESLHAVADALRERDVTVIEVAGHHLEQEVPYGALETLLEKPKEGAKGEQAARGALTERLAGDRATLIVDDAHWLDPASRHVLVGVAGRAAEQGIGVVVAHRPVAADADLAALDAALSPNIIRLEPLDNDGIAERSALLLEAAVDDTLVDALLVRTEGVALLVDTLVRGWRDADRLERGSLRDESPPAVPPPVIELVRARVDQLPESERRLLVTVSLGSALDDELLAGVAELPAEELGACTDGLRARGLLVPGHDEPLPVIADAVLAMTPEADQRRLHGRCAEAMTARGDPPARAVEHVIASGGTGPDAVSTLVAAADAALGEGLGGTAGELLDRAAEAGAADIAGRRAEAAALSGDLDTALELADAALAESDEPDRARAVAVLGGVLANRGLWSRAVQLLTSVQGHPHLPDDLFKLVAVPGLVARGRIDEATASFAAASETIARPAPLVVEAVVATARGAVAAGRGELEESLAALSEAADLLESSPARLVLPDTPHALAAVVAAAACDFTRAEQMLTDALAHDAGGPALANRHRLLLGWVALRAGRWAHADTVLDETKSAVLGTRERLLRAAVEAGVARRSGDITRLESAWEEAEPALLRAQPGLFSLEPLAELAIAGARLGAVDRARDQLSAIGTILADLDRPALWTLPLAWSRLESVIADDDTGGVANAAAAIDDIEPAATRLATLAPAARAWADVLMGSVDPDAVEAAATGLSDAGLPWEASRLVGQAAIRATEPAQTRTLLERARDLKGALPREEVGERAASAGVLSEREEEVGRQVLDGLTHKEIGALLFISPKTVEHHVARIRQKLGVTTRAELLAALRDRG